MLELSLHHGNAGSPRRHWCNSAGCCCLSFHLCASAAHTRASAINPQALHMQTKGIHTSCIKLASKAGRGVSKVTG